MKFDFFYTIQIFMFNIILHLKNKSGNLQCAHVHIDTMLMGRISTENKRKPFRTLNIIKTTQALNLKK